LDFAALDDEALVRRCQQGDAAAWSVLVRRYQRLVYTIPRRAGLSEEESADVFQATFTRLFRAIDRLKDPARIRAWLVTTAHRETLRVLKQRRDGLPTVSIDDAFPDGDAEEAEPGPDAGFPTPPGTSSEPSVEERWDEVRQALDRLEPRCRQLLELLFLSDLEPSYAEVSQRLGMPVGSIGPTRSRCLEHLRKRVAVR
jgi:RNA polymerase sigma factor (sigma-70 family)